MELNNIDKNLKVPLHYQIYKDIHDKIEKGYYKINEKMPSEAELQSIYNVSRITVRSAMQELEKDDYVKKFRGIGTIVCEPKRKFDLQHLTSFSSDANTYGKKPSSILLNFEIAKPSKKIAAALNISEDEEVYCIERTRLRGEVIVGFHKAYIKRSNNLVLNESDITPETSLYALIEERGVHLTSADELLEAQIPSTSICNILGIKKTQPIFYVERITFNHRKEPIEYVEMFYRADKYQYKVTLDLVSNKQ